MLQDLWPGNAPLFGDMPHHKDRQALLLGGAHDPHGALPHLADAAGGGADLRVRDGLHRVNDHDLRLKFLHAGQDAADIRLRQDIERRIIDRQPQGPQLQLTLTLLPGDIEDLLPLLCQTAHLEQKGGFTDARSAAHQDQRPYHRTAAQHPVQLGNAGGKADLRRRVQVCQALWLLAIARSGAGGRAAPPAPGVQPELRQGVPGPAGRAFSGPVRGLRAAFGAAINGFLSVCHFLYVPYVRICPEVNCR